MAKYQHVILAIDVMFVNKIPFLITTSHDIKFNTIEMLSSNRILSQVQKSFWSCTHENSYSKFTHINLHILLMFLFKT